MIDFYLEHHELDMIVARLSVVMQFSKLAAEVLPLIFVKILALFGLLMVDALMHLCPALLQRKPCVCANL